MEAPNQDYFSSQHSSRGLPISLAPAAAESGEEGSLAEGQAVTGFRENASLRSREFIFLEQEGSLFWQWGDRVPMDFPLPDQNETRACQPTR